jgi:hypothetical protein
MTYSTTAPAKKIEKNKEYKVILAFDVGEEKLKGKKFTLHTAEYFSGKIVYPTKQE